MDVEGTSHTLQQNFSQSPLCISILLARIDTAIAATAAQQTHFKYVWPETELIEYENKYNFDIVRRIVTLTEVSF